MRAFVAGVSPRLTALDLWIGHDSDVTLEDVAPLLERPLEQLALRGTRFTNEIVLTLAQSAPAMRALDLRHGRLDDAGAHVIVARADVFRRLARLRLEHNRLSLPIMEALATELGRERVVVAPQMGVGPTSRDAMEAVLAEERRDEQWDSDFTPSPYDAYRLADDLLAKVEHLPFLLAELDSRDEARRKWATFALERLGAESGRDASDVLARRAPSFAFWRVDRGRAEARGVHRDGRVRKEITDALRREPAALGAHLARLLDDPDPGVTKFALEQLDELTRDDAYAVPVERVRTLLDHPERSIRDAAASRLVELHLPADAARIIASIASGRAMPMPLFADWAGSHPTSDQLYDQPLPLSAIAQIVRRRRVAGLPNDFGRLRGRVLDALTAPMNRRDDRARAHAIGHAANILEELREPSLARELALAVGPADDVDRFEGRGDFDDILRALRSLGDAGARAVADVLPTTRAEREQRLRWLRDALAREPAYAPVELETADAYFLEARLEDFLLPDRSAYGAYALVLNADPRCSYAAFQAAWIERGFGTPIVAERVRWLASLGVDAALLDALAEPPDAIIPGHTWMHHKARQEDAALAEAALAAGLPSVAARYLPKEQAPTAELAAREHLERVRAGCR